MKGIFSLMAGQVPLLHPLQAVSRYPKLNSPVSRRVEGLRMMKTGPLSAAAKTFPLRQLPPATAQKRLAPSLTLAMHNHRPVETEVSGHIECDAIN